VNTVINHRVGLRASSVSRPDRCNTVQSQNTAIKIPDEKLCLRQSWKTIKDV